MIEMSGEARELAAQTALTLLKGDGTEKEEHLPSERGYVDYIIHLVSSTNLPVRWRQNGVFVTRACWLSNQV
jgi:hypothetical protein